MKLLAAGVAVVACLGCGTSDDPAAGGGGAGGSAAFPPPNPDGCIADPSAGDRLFDCADVVKFYVTVPELCLEQACGVILDVHGGTMTASSEDQNTDLRALGRQHGYIVVQPEAPGSPPIWSNVHVPKVRAFVDRVLAVWHADARRVHVTGLSQGGSMTWKFLCEYGDIVASVAPTAESPQCGGFPGSDADCFQTADRPAVHQKPLLYMHGTKDAIQPFPCAEQARDLVLSSWGMKNEELVSQSDKHVWKRWTNDAGNVFEFIAHDYSADVALIAGHCFPGPREPNLLGCADQDFAFRWGDVVMDFFLAHPLAGP